MRSEPFTVVGLHGERFAPTVPFETGRIPLVVICHGAMDRAAGFWRTIRSLRSCEVVAYDRRGYASSVDSAPCETLADSAQDLLAVLDFARSGRLDPTAPTIVVGHSQGGLIAATALIADPPSSPAVAVIWEPPMPWEPWYHRSTGNSVLELEPAAAADQFLRAVLGERVWSRVPRVLRQEREREGAALLADLRMSRAPEAEPAFELLRTPVLSGHGTRSAPHNRRSAETLAARVESAELVRIEGANHGVHLSHPGELASLIIAAPDRLRPGHPR